MKIPNATYRIQFGPAFTFKDAHKIVDYLAALGVHWIYASPIFKARRGSLHGYDVTDANRLNPEIGSRSDFSRLQQALRRHGMGWLQDTVPNHMAYSGENPLLADLFALDEKAVSDGYFDIWWSGAGPAGRRRLAAPFLGDSLAACLEKKEIRPVLRQGILGVQYYAHFFPLRLESYGILTPPPGILNARSSSAWPSSAAYAPLSDTVATLQRCAERPFSAARDGRIAKAREKLHSLMENRPDIRTWVHRCLENYDPVQGGADAADALKKLLGAQVFELRWWQTAARDINYRRFFDINELISLRQELPSVFEHTHRGLRTLLQKGLIDGLRVDHVDGLRDPAAYLRSLRRVCGGIYLVVEKILGPRETLPSSWPVQGTTGYEFADRLTRLFCRADRQNALDRICRAFTGREDSFETVCSAARRQVLAECFGGELAHLVQLTQKAAAASYAAPAGGAAALRRALRQLLIRFPVYRTYAAGGAADQGDAALIQSIAEAAGHRHPRRAPALAFVRDCLVGNGPHAACGSLPNADCEEIAARFQQLCAPLAAKGVEDTALYRYHRLTALNEVGGDPRRAGISRAAFHTFMAQRTADWPQAMNGLSSHDSKRSEDVRARISVLSEMPAEWERQCASWRDMNRGCKAICGDRRVPDAGTEYFLYQTLVGTLPLARRDMQAYRERMRGYMVKAAREAKEKTSWRRPRQAYENALSGFVDRLLTDDDGNRFLRVLTPFVHKIGFYGTLNSLSQTLIKTTAPGIPDIYQGTEVLNFSLVDPDNRRPVDFAYRRRLLQKIQKRQHGSGLRWRTAYPLGESDGDRMKLQLTQAALQQRRRRRTLFLHGAYIPLTTAGRFARHLLAFARIYEGQYNLTVAPRWFVSVVSPGRAPLGRVWSDTVIRLPDGFPALWTDVLSGRRHTGRQTLSAAAVFTSFPAALLEGEKDQ